MRVLILGAGIFHSKSIVDIKDAGFEVIVLDGNPTAPALKIADHSEVCDITNKSVVYELAKNGRLMALSHLMILALALLSMLRKSYSSSLQATSQGFVVMIKG